MRALKIADPQIEMNLLRRPVRPVAVKFGAVASLGVTTQVSSNLTLLCRYHHHNYLSRGWTCEIASDGLPWWRPPKWLDQEQQPILNTRIRLAHLAESAVDHTPRE
jgi:hypothetical protein